MNLEIEEENEVTREEEIGEGNRGTEKNVEEEEKTIVVNSTYLEGYWRRRDEKLELKKRRRQ